jgi:hypothetical protein
MNEREIYKGIEFVRISNLPTEQSERIKASVPKEKIIKILKDEVILKDCLQYHHYQEWFRETYQLQQEVVLRKPESTYSNSFNLALK